ncbi:tRNA (adenosine(37)-N6)-dimethylallyltransferase MiaA [Sporichthya polymorpha]|uniref:tRNA (adenosine(37)-N6)-dimethylallyltransferase MiaA n=1 Tax=Sporichthya polymorpha TaxID=35751 RepID=UPI0003714E11|nr:tRNA (adenosine(37)-N6)-dimethylallyltransferase MiaA [Sporichthya polymorpha]
MSEPLVVAVVGPTATGKSALGIELAKRLGGEVVNTDSMQLYRGMDIGTAKLSPAERAGVPHHLLDLWEVTEPAAVAVYQRLARQVVADLLAAGKSAVLVGGSGLYVRAVLDDLDFPGTEPEVRSRLEAELEEVGAPALHARLATLDPVAAERILPGNGRRIVRALEVIELTGQPFTAKLPDPRYVRPAVQIGLGADRETLDRRLDERVDAMWAAGLVDEVRSLLPRGLREGRTASKALGYAQVLQFLDGVCDEDAARAETQRATRKFARRQMAWFGRDARVRWLPADHPQLVDAALAALERPLPAGTDRAGSVL